MLPSVGDPMGNQVWLWEARVSGLDFRGRKPGESGWGLGVGLRGVSPPGPQQWPVVATSLHPGGRWTTQTRTRMVGTPGRGRQGLARLVSRHGLGSTPRPVLTVAPTRPPRWPPGAWKRQALQVHGCFKSLDGRTRSVRRTNTPQAKRLKLTHGIREGRRLPTWRRGQEC